MFILALSHPLSVKKKEKEQMERKGGEGRGGGRQRQYFLETEERGVQLPPYRPLLGPGPPTLTDSPDFHLSLSTLRFNQFV